MTDRRVVVTGVGAVTPYGIGAGTLIDSWCEGESGIRDGVGTCDDFDPADFFKRKELKRFDRFSQLAVVAADEALAMAGWKDDGLPADADRIGCVMGTASGGLSTLVEGTQAFIEGGARNVMWIQLLIPKAMDNAAASVIALRNKLEGPSHALASFCSSGSDTIAEGLRMLRLGEVDAMLVGGAEAGIHRLPLVAFTNMKTLSPTGVARPFDARRDGFVLGEGAAVLVLEAAEVAERRGAHVVGEVLGYGSTNDAHDVVTPDPEARGAAKAIDEALADAGVGPGDIDYVNAHGIGTQATDRAESAAIERSLGDRARTLPVSALKSAIGHPIGASGAIESVATLLALGRGVAPPTLNWEVRDDGLDLDYVPGEARPLFGNGAGPAKERAIALSTAFGFGGHNSALVLAASPNGAGSANGAAS